MEGKDAAPKVRKVKKLSEGTLKKPEGMHRELYALLCSDYRRDPPTLAPTDTGIGYRQPKAKIGRSRVRSWKWMDFTNPARSDGLVLYHWRRKLDEGKEYPFAKFGKAKHDITYTVEEYENYLVDESGNWSEDETNYLFELSRQFSQRFVVMNDRYDTQLYPNRVMEDLKDRYYKVVRALAEGRTPPGQKVPDIPPEYDCDHEKNRKEQLVKLFNRTPEQVEEEEMLVAELKKIEGRKKEREKKSQDVNKLITATENKPSAIVTSDLATAPILQDIHQAIKKEKGLKKPGKKSRKRRPDSLIDSTKVNKEQQGIKFPEIKGSGVFLRSSKLKMPPSVGTKKSKAVEQLLEELSVDIIPMPTEEICQNFNELRNQLLLLYELKQAMGTCEYELQTMKHQYELICPGKLVSELIGFSLDPPPAEVTEDVSAAAAPPVPAPGALLIDSVATVPVIGSRKRRTATALLENNPWKKTKKI